MLKKDLDKLIICNKCKTVHKKVNLQGKSSARCSECDNILYRNSKIVFNRVFALSLGSLFLFIVANSFPIMKIYILSQSATLTIPDMIQRLFSDGFIILGSIVFVVLLATPFLMLLAYITLGFLTYTKCCPKQAKNLIIFIIQTKHWAMVDIFFVSILVALVKLFGYVEVHFDVAFIALFLFVIVDAFTIKAIKPVELWQYYQRTYKGDK